MHNLHALSVGFRYAYMLAAAVARFGPSLWVQTRTRHKIHETRWRGVCKDCYSGGTTHNYTTINSFRWCAQLQDITNIQVGKVWICSEIEATSLERGSEKRFGLGCLTILWITWQSISTDLKEPKELPQLKSAQTYTKSSWRRSVIIMIIMMMTIWWWLVFNNSENLRQIK